MRKAIIISTAAALALLAGCGNQSNQNSGIKIPPKWQGAPYHIAFGPIPAKPNPSGVTIPPITFTANPDMLETRADLVVEFDTSSLKKDYAVPNRMILAPTDISGAQGSLPADYVDLASKELAKMLASDCIKGKVKTSVALTKSSIQLTATEDEINSHRLSDWLPITIDFKNPHPKC